MPIGSSSSSVRAEFGSAPVAADQVVDDGHRLLQFCAGMGACAWQRSMWSRPSRRASLVGRPCCTHGQPPSKGGETVCETGRAKIAELPESDRSMVERLHAVIKASAPAPRRNSGAGCPRMPRTARSSASSKVRRSQQQVYDVRLQRHGEPRRRRPWPTSFARTELTAADEARIGAPVKKAVS